MKNTVLNYLKSLSTADNIAPEFMLPDFHEPVLIALGLDKDKITLEELADNIDETQMNDELFIKLLFGNPYFDTSLISLDFLAAIITSPHLINIVNDENCKKKIFKIYGETLKNLNEEDPEFVVINMDSIQTLIEACGEDFKAKFSAILRDKIAEVKAEAKNIKSKEDLFNFAASPYIESDPDKTVDAAIKNLISVYGEDDGAMFGEIYKNLYETGQGEDERQQNAYGIALAFDAKISALRKVWNVADNEARQNFMVGGM